MFRPALPAVAAALLSACTTDIGVVTATDPASFRDPAYVVYDNRDTLAIRDINILLRTDSRFDGRPVELTVGTLAPDSTFFEEPFTIVAGQGRRSDSHVETTAAYRHETVLRQRGRYVFTFTPAGDSRGTAGITGIGIKIENGKE